MAANTKGGGGINLLIPVLLLVMVGFLFLSTRKRKAQAQQMQTALRAGSKIMTTAGLYATVVRVEDDGVVLEVAPGVHSKYARAAIAKVLDAPEGAEPLDGPADDASETHIDLDKKDPPAAS